MNTAYLIYRPVLDYEESETPYGISLTLEGAKAMKATILEHARAVMASLPKGATADPWESECDGLTFISDEEKLEDFNADKWLERQDFLKAVVWPYGIDLGGEFNLWSPVPHLIYTSDFDALISIRELPLV